MMTVMFMVFTSSRSLIQQLPITLVSPVCQPWSTSRINSPTSMMVSLKFSSFIFKSSSSGELMDGEEVLKWMMTHLESAEIEEVSSSMLGRLIRDTRNIVVIFCKYIAYAIIALTHTCYLIKNYAPDQLKKYLPPGAVRGMASET